MKIFEGKKLLMLGTNVGTFDMLRYAKENGAYTIVADYLPAEKSAGKQIADEHLMISTSDTDALSSIIKEKRIDGVFAGVSEFNLLQAMALSEQNGLRFYCNRDQWDAIESKDRFRALCEAYGVASPRTFYAGAAPESYTDYELPVIVKPVDGCSSMGITICREASELPSAFRVALSHSICGRVIVEEFFEGEEFSAHYTIANGEVTLSSVDNRCPVAVNEGAVTTIPIARFYPSTFIQSYIEQVDESMKKLCRSLELEIGVVFVQGLYNRLKNEFRIFEAGLRCAGEAPYRIIDRTNGCNFIYNFIDYALLGKIVNFDAGKEDPMMHGKVCGTVGLVCKGGGKVGQIIGLEETVEQLPQIVDFESRYQIGDEVPSGNTLRQIMIRFVLVCDNKQQMSDCIDYINAHTDVLNEDGRSMCVKYTTYKELD